MRSAVLLLAFSMAGCLVPAEDEPKASLGGDLVTIEPPEFSVGDHWVFVDSEGNRSEERIFEAEVVQEEGEAFQRLSVSQGERRFERWLRLRDGAVYVMDAHPVRETGPMSVTFFTPPCPSIFGTHRIGDEWSQECVWNWAFVNETKGTVEEPINTTLHETYRFLGPAVRTLETGPEDTWHFQVWRRDSLDPAQTPDPDDAPLDLFYSERLCTWVKSDQYPIDEVLSGSCAKGRPTAP